MKILVVIASYGRANEHYLIRALDEYRRMRHHIDVVVLSNMPRALGPDVEVVVVQLKTDPWSLPFAHRNILEDRISNYDLFIYSEDDLLISEQNIQAFLRATDVLPGDEIAGFLHAETDSQGRLYYVGAHSHFHWDPASVRLRGGDLFASFTNEHSGCFLLTTKQLRQAIQSGGFLVGPHQEKYDLLVTAATDPYIQCGFKKMICISQLDDFTIRHLPNKKYKGRPYEERGEFCRQVEELSALEKNGYPKTTLFETGTKVQRGKWSKSYYEPYDPFSNSQGVQSEVVSTIPASVRTVLSIGCGWGETEGSLVKRGIRVVGMPLDSVIAASAKARGVEIVYGDFEAARRRLAGEQFDCILMSYLLHLVPNPLRLLSSFTELLSAQGLVLITVPNFAQAGVRWRRIFRDDQYKDLGSYSKTGIHLTTHKLIARWFRSCRLKVTKIVNVFPDRIRWARRPWFDAFPTLLASEFMAIGTRM